MPRRRYHQVATSGRYAEYARVQSCALTDLVKICKLDIAPPNEELMRLGTQHARQILLQEEMAKRKRDKVARKARAGGGRGGLLASITAPRNNKGYLSAVRRRNSAMLSPAAREKALQKALQIAQNRQEKRKNRQGSLFEILATQLTPENSNEHDLLRRLCTELDGTEEKGTGTEKPLPGKRLRKGNTVRLERLTSRALVNVGGKEMSSCVRGMTILRSMLHQLGESESSIDTRGGPIALHPTGKACIDECNVVFTALQACGDEFCAMMEAAKRKFNPWVVQVPVVPQSQQTEFAPTSLRRLGEPRTAQRRNDFFNSVQYFAQASRKAVAAEALDSKEGSIGGGAEASARVPIAFAFDGGTRDNAAEELAARRERSARVRESRDSRSAGRAAPQLSQIQGDSARQVREARRAALRAEEEDDDGGEELGYESSDVDSDDI